MKLDVIVDRSTQQQRQQQPWYAEGLRFTCQQCGNCCTGGPGFVWISLEEIERLAAHLHLTPQETVDRYCRKIEGKFSLREHRNARGEYDCIFLKEQEVERTVEGDQRIVHAKRVCTVYPARPLQCRTWPFWSENLKSQEAWKQSGRRCPGMDAGRKYSRKQIEALRDAKDWPARAPTSE